MSDILRTTASPGASGVGVHSNFSNTFTQQQNINTTLGSGFNQVIIEQLAPRVPRLANKQAVFFARIAPNTDPQIKLNPRGYRCSVETQPNASQKFLAEGGAHSKGHGREYTSLTIFYSRASQGTRLTLDTLDAMETGQAIETLKTYLAEDIRDFMRFLNFSAYQDGKGIRATIQTTITGGIAAGATATVDFNNIGRVKGLQVGGRYDIHNPTAPFAKVNTNPVTVVSINVSAATAEIKNNDSTALPINAGDVLVKEGSFGLDIAGLAYLIDDTSTGEIFGVSRGSDAIFRAQIDRSGGALSIAKLRSRVQSYKHQRGADRFNASSFVLLMSPSQFDAYQALGDPTVNSAVSGIRYDVVAGARKLDIGNDLIQASYGNIPIIEDDSCPNDRIYGIYREDLSRAEFKPVHLLTPYGTSPWFPVPAFDAAGIGTLLDQKMTLLKWVGNLVVKMPAEHLGIFNLSTTGLTNF